LGKKKLKKKPKGTDKKGNHENVNTSEGGTVAKSGVVTRKRGGDLTSNLKVNHMDWCPKGPCSGGVGQGEKRRVKRVTDKRVGTSGLA